MYDLLIKGGKVVDGSGAPWFWADVAVAGDRIAAIGRLGDAGAAEVVDVGGQCVAPGFIDIHSHSDLPILVNPRAESKIRQGVTTEVIGQCGSSAAPSAGESTIAMAAEYGLEITWDSMAGYVREVTRRGVAVNVVPVVGHNAVRVAVMGYERRAPSSAELAAMCDLVEQACREGARGFSSGLIYPPSAYAEADELVALCAAAARHGAVYMTHIRNEGEGLLGSVQETVDVARRAGIGTQISHHKAVGRDNWGRVRESLAMLEEARRSGVDVTCDQYPYTASSTGLAAVIPQWAHEGGPARMLQRLADPEDAARIRREMEQAALRRGGWDDVLIAGTATPELKQCEGLTVGEIAAARGTDPITAVFDLLLAGKYVSMIRFGMSEEDVKTVMRHPLVMMGSDGSCLADYGPLSAGKPHPRNYGTFVRVLGKYVREEGNLTLEEAVRKMTSLPAARMNLGDRGLLRPGLAADITVFDPDTVAERATYVDPHQYAQGISLVVVNGRIAVQDGAHTGRLAGRVLTGGVGA